MYFVIPFGITISKDIK